MAIECASYNLKDALNEPAGCEQVLDWLAEANPDVIAFQEAHAENRARASLGFMYQAADLGYLPYSSNYDDTDGRQDRHALMLLTRRELVPEGIGLHGLVQLGGRVALWSTVEDPMTGQMSQVWAAHMPDRSQAYRASFVADLCREIDDRRQRLPRGVRPHGEVILADGNAIHDGRQARLLQRVEPLVKHLPVQDPGERAERMAAALTAAGRWHERLSRFGSLATRFCEMADDSVASLENIGMADADPDHAATFPARWPVAQLDRIMHNGELQVLDFVRHDRGVSDHRAIQATLAQTA